MEIVRINENRKRYLNLLLMADEEECMIDRYLDKGDMFVLKDGASPVGVAVITHYGPGSVELKNLAIAPDRRGRGLGRRIIEFLCREYSGNASHIYVGTGDVPATRGFYEHCGFRYSHRITDFFTDNYRQPIIEDGIRLTDMIYLTRPLQP